MSVVNDLIMLVDDTPDNINVLRKLLGSEGYKIAIAPSGKKALELIPKVLPSLILLDIMMPDVSGYEVCKQIKDDITTKDIPVIFISAKTDIDDMIEGFKLGALDYITKPFRHEEVLHRVRIQLQLRASLQKVELQNKKLIEFNEAKNRMMGTVAHDLRNPIGAILGYSDIILDDFDFYIKNESDKISDMVAKIQSISHQLNTQVNDLLDSSAIENGTLTLNKSLFSIESLITERLEISKYRLKFRHIEVSLDLSDGLEVVADPARISQVIDNIIGNAIKFSPDNSQITIKISTNEQWLNISIKDQGQGIADDKLESIFESFSVSEAHLSAGDKSTGLGLAIVKKIIEVHQGEMHVHSQPGKGAEFIICLPLKISI